MRAAELHRLSRTLREVALAASGDAHERPTYGEIAVVEDLALHGPSPIGVVAERTGVAQSLVSKVARALVDAGVVETAADPADGRRRVLSLVPGVVDGLLRPRGDRPVAEALAAVAPHLDAAAAARTEALLAQLAALLRDPDGQDAR